MLRDLSRDARFALRLAARDPWFTLVASATLALGIGFDATLYAIVSGMGSGPPVAARDRVVAIGSLDPAGRALGVSYLDFQDWRAAKRLASAAAYSGAAMNVTDRGLAAERVSGAYVSAGTFALLGERPILGRDFVPSDDRIGATPVVIIAASVWKGRYGGDAGIIGRTITVNGVPMAIIGVMREGFRFPLVHDMWQPLASMPGLAAQPRDRRSLSAAGRLADGASLEQARGELNTIAQSLSRAFPATNGNVRATVRPATGGFDLSNPWNAMLAAVSFVLLIACANVANLLLARAAHRSHEIAIRRSLGATRWRIVRQLLVESALLAVVAGIGGVAIAAIGVRVWLASMPVANWPYWYHFAVDRRVLAYLVALSAGSVLLFGVGPALHASASHPVDDLKDRGRGGAFGGGARRWTSALLVAEFALTLSLLAGAGLLARTLLAVHRADAIVDTSHVLLAGLDLPPQRYATPAQRTALFSEFEARVAALPGVQAATLASATPFYTAPVWSVSLEGQQPAAPLAGPTASYVSIGPGYFATLGLQPLRGRVFTDRDGTPGNEAAVVTQLFASTYLPGLDPIGRRIRLIDPDAPNTPAPWLTIVGVTPTVRQHYAEEIDPVVYVPYRWQPRAGMVLMVRTEGGVASLTATLRDVLRAVDEDLPLLDIRPLDWLVSGTRFANRVFAPLFGLSAALGLLLAAVGLHAMTDYAIRRRTQEIGVRMALGAEPRQVVWLFVRRTIAPLALGVVLGLLGSLGVGQFVRGMLIQTSPTDPLTLTSITLVLIAVALIAAVRPARRAACIDPAAALRAE